MSVEIFKSLKETKEKKRGEKPSDCVSLDSLDSVLLERLDGFGSSASS